MVIAVDPNKKYDFVLKSDKTAPKENQTVFKLRALTASEMADVMDIMAPGTQIKTICGLGLIGWDNLKDEGGNSISFPLLATGKPDPIALDRIPKIVRTQIAEEVMKIS